MRQDIKERIEKIRKGELPEGYKKTKVGVIPENWEVKKVGELGEFKKGKGISSNEVTEEGFSAMMYGDIYIKYDTKFEKVDYKIPEDISKNSTEVYKGDLLFTCSGETAKEIGKCVCYIGDENIFIGGDIIGLTPKEDDSLFLAYQQNGYNLIKQKARLGQGHSVVHIYLAHIQSLKMAITSLQEQQSIANILSTWDKAIELKEKLIEEKKKQKKGLMSDLLTSRVRLNGFEDKWEEVKLGECIVEISKRNKDISINRVYSINNKKGFIDQSDQFGKEVASQNTDNYKIVRDGNIAYNPSRINVGSIAKLSGEIGIISPMYVVFDTLKYNLLTDYMMYWVDTNEFNQKIKNMMTGSVRDSLNFKDLCYIKLYIPNIDEQGQIVKILTCLDEEIELLEKELEEIKIQKKGLMQLLLTGIVRVS